MESVTAAGAKAELPHAARMRRDTLETSRGPLLGRSWEVDGEMKDKRTTNRAPPPPAPANNARKQTKAPPRGVHLHARRWRCSLAGHVVDCAAAALCAVLGLADWEVGTAHLLPSAITADGRSFRIDCFYISDAIR
ncbi:unnamed protein product, partial [Iphiclides podalirius]